MDTPPSLLERVSTSLDLMERLSCLLYSRLGEGTVSQRNNTRPLYVHGHPSYGRLCQSKSGSDWELYMIFFLIREYSPIGSRSLHGVPWLKWSSFVHVLDRSIATCIPILFSLPELFSNTWQNSPILQSRNKQMQSKHNFSTTSIS